MRSLYFLFLVIFCFSVSFSADTLFFLGIGQSNMAGNISGSYTSTTGLKWTGTTWAAYSDPGPGGGCTPWPGFINYLRTNYSTDTVYAVINMGWGGKGFVDSWQDTTSAPYDTMHRNVDRANKVISGIFCIGGEQDMTDGRTQAATSAAIDSMVAHLRLHIPYLPPIFFCLTHRTDATATAVRAAILSKHNDATGIHVETDIYALPPQDAVHRPKTQLDKVGESFARSWMVNRSVSVPSVTYKTDATYHVMVSTVKYLIPDTLDYYSYIFDLSRIPAIGWESITDSTSITVMDQYTGTECAKWAHVDHTVDSGYVVWAAPVSFAREGRFLIECGTALNVANDADAATNSGYTFLSADGLLDIAAGADGALVGAAAAGYASVWKGLYTNGTTGSISHGSTIVGDGAVTTEVVFKPIDRGENNNAYLQSNGKYVMAFYKEAAGSPYVMTTRNGATTLFSLANPVTLNAWNSYLISSTAAGVCTLYTNKNRLTNGSAGTPAAGTYNMVFNNSNGDDRTLYGFTQWHGVSGARSNTLAWGCMVHNCVVDQTTFADITSSSLTCQPLPNPYYAGRVVSFYGTFPSSQGTAYLRIAGRNMNDAAYWSATIVNDTLPVDLPRGKWPVYLVDGTDTTTLTDLFQVVVPSQTIGRRIRRDK